MAPKSGSETQGGGFRGGPKRWTGNGPRPARHIPWPELFKHHQSVLTGHLKMMDMVRKHCVEGTGNYTTAQACVDRTHQMMKMFKEVTWNFVPPKDNIDRVPLGASSASMYPGYSPADHIYGEAAQEYGHYAAEKKKQGVELKSDPNGPQYEVGQNRKVERSQEANAAEAVSEGNMPDSIEQNVQGEETQGDPMEDVQRSEEASQFFVIDTKPTPREELPNFVSQSGPTTRKGKRRVSFAEGEETIPDSNGETNERRRKRSKITTGEEVPGSSFQSKPPAEDLSAEVEARLKAKEEKKRRRDEKKRKREGSDTTAIVPVNGATGLQTNGKAKKTKHRHDSGAVGDGHEANIESHQDTKREKKKKKKRAGVEDSTP